MKVRVALAFAYFFLVMTSYYCMKPLREALFLDWEGVGNFPKVHMMLVWVTYVAAQLYDSVARRVRPGWLACRTLPLCSLAMVAFWLCLSRAAAGTPLYHLLIWVYYLGVSLYCVFAVAFFWSLTHSAFTTEEGKRYYGWIGVGGILGGAMGGLLTRWLVPQWGSPAMLLVAAALLVPCFGLARRLDDWRLSENTRLESSASKGNWLDLLREQSYLRGIALLVMLVLAFEEFGDHQTQRLLADFHITGDDLTVFYGELYWLVNSLGCLISLGLVRPLLTRLGPGPGLLILPLVTALKAVAVLLWPTRQMLLITLSLDLGLFYSLFQASKELLYTPTGEDVRFRAKTMIDTFFFRLGAGLAAALVLFFLLQRSQAEISTCIGICAILAALVGAWLARRFQSLSLGVRLTVE